MKYNGKCHCGQVAFEVEGNLESAIECNCTICSQSGYLHWMIEPSQLHMKTPLDKAKLYLWGTGQARHYFCPKCGVAVLRNPRTDPDKKYSVNVRCLEGVDIAKLKLSQFDGLNKLKV
ncbi:MAG TPA: GFA family protein [Candidatus Binataceae bacterium]|nr:GFA family protein [Candidatus Binataceae bacterium]